MSARTGGVAAAFGFRYQYLVTVELLLEYHERRADDWSVDVDRADQDSADILVYVGTQAAPDVAIQVKASLESSSTRLGRTACTEIIGKLRSEHPGAREYRIVTNRELTGELATLNQAPLAMQPPSAAERVVIDHRSETLYDVAADLLRRIERIRGRGPGGVGDLVHHLILRNLVDLVHEHGARDVDQRITSADVGAVLNIAPAALAEATGARRWGATYQVPRGQYVERAAVSRFLEDGLPLESLVTGRVRAAVLSGLSGGGKSSAAALFASGRLEHVAFVVWLDARSEDALRAQIPAVLAWLGATPSVGDSSAQIWTDLLAELPVPWLLVLDGAEDPDVVRQWIPTSGYGHVIVTTRNGEWAPSTAPVFGLGRLGPDEAEALLRARLAGPSGPSSSDIDSETCRRLTERLAGWPLALEYAASWLRLRGRGVADLDVLLERLDRLDLDDPQLGPDAYPATATGVIRDVCNDLPADAQLLLGGMVSMAGRGPVRPLSDWVEACGGDASAAVRDLGSVSIAQRLIMDDRRGPHEFDEVLQVHDAVLLVLGTAGFPMRQDHFVHLVQAISATLEQLVHEGRFIEAAALVLPADGVLRTLLTSGGVPDGMKVLGTMLMHNLGMTATMVGLPTLAEQWLTCAINVRDRFAPENVLDKPGAAVLQLQTLGALGQVLAQGPDLDKLRLVADRAVDLLGRHPGVAAQGTPSVSMTLVPLARALQQYDPDAAALPVLADITADATPTPQGTGGEIVTRLQMQLDMARRLARAERWTESVDIALAAANASDARGVLVGVMVEGLFSIAAELALSLLQRPHSTPPGVLDGLRRLVAWLEALDDATPSQSVRLCLLRSISTVDPGAIEVAVRAARGQPEAATPQVAEWIEAAGRVLGLLQGQWLSRSLPLGGLPPGISVIRTIDGGGDSMYWLTVDEANGVPVVVFCTTSIVEFTAEGTRDPLEARVRASGLVGGVDNQGRPRVADGWTLTVGDGVVILRDGAGWEWLRTQGPLPDFFLDAMAASDVALVIYADLGDTDLADLPSDRPAGLVRIVHPSANSTMSRGRIRDRFSSWFARRR